MYSEIAANKRKTGLLMVGFFGLVAGMGWLLSANSGNESFLPFVIGGTAAYTLFSYFTGSKVALMMNGAKEIQKRDNPRLWRVVENLSIAEGMPMPKVYVIHDHGLNAFATGRDPHHAAVAATTGLLDAMNDKELEGVMAHELGHIKNYDIRVSMIAFALVVAIGFIADILWRVRWFGSDDDNNASPLFMLIGFVAAFLAPLLASMIQLAISRKREYLADATGALTTRYPEGLASALEKLRDHGSALKRQNPTSAHLFFANPLKKGAIVSLFSTHPPIDERIARLRSMGHHG